MEHPGVPGTQETEVGRLNQGVQGQTVRTVLNREKEKRNIEDNTLTSCQNSEKPVQLNKERTH